MVTIPGEAIALIGADSVKILDADGHTRQVMGGVEVPVHDAAFMGPDRLFIARQDGFIDVYDIDEGVRVGSIPAHEGYVIRLLPIEGERLLSAGADGAVRLWGAKALGQQPAP